MTDLVARLRADLKDTLRSRDREATRVLRTVLSAIANAEAQPSPTSTGLSSEGPIAGAADGLGAADVARRELTDDDVRSIVAAERDERLTAADDLEQRGALEAAVDLRAEAARLDPYLS